MISTRLIDDFAEILAEETYRERGVSGGMRDPEDPVRTIDQRPQINSSDDERVFIGMQILAMARDRR